MNKGIHHQAIIMSLQPMFDEAEAGGLWFYHDSKEVPDLWASCEYLHYMHTKGRMIWSPEHWELRDPIDYLRQLHRSAIKKLNEYNDLAKRLQFPSIEVTELIMGVPNEEDAAITADKQSVKL